MATLLALPALPAAHAEVLCVRAKKDGSLSGAIKVRRACAKREVEVDAVRLGLCCQGTATTTTTTLGGVTTTIGGATTTLVGVTTSVTATIVTTTSLTCPSLTTTTLGANVCGGNPPTCLGLCANAHGCVDDGVACSCTGPLLPCGVVTKYGACGGSCPAGETCMQTVVVGSGGCPEAVTCACVAP